MTGPTSSVPLNTTSFSLKVRLPNPMFMGRQERCRRTWVFRSWNLRCGLVLNDIPVFDKSSVLNAKMSAAIQFTGWPYPTSMAATVPMGVSFLLSPK